MALSALSLRALWALTLLRALTRLSSGPSLSVRRSLRRSLSADNRNR